MNYIFIEYSSSWHRVRTLYAWRVSRVHAQVRGGKLSNGAKPAVAGLGALQEGGRQLHPAIPVPHSPESGMRRDACKRDAKHQLSDSFRWRQASAC